MGKRGPKPKPSALKLVQGTFRPDRAAAREPKPPRPARAPAPPSFLGKLAKQEWRRVAPVLHKLTLLGKGDIGKLAAYCQAYARWREAERIIDEQGMTFMTDKGYVVQRPEISISKSQATLMRQLGSDFGLDPSSRTRIDVPEPEKPATGDEAFLFGGKTVKHG